MEELADYFSQRLAKCQKQVYNVVNQVQSQVGDMGDSSMQGTSTNQQSQVCNRTQHQSTRCNLISMIGCMSFFSTTNQIPESQITA